MAWQFDLSGNHLALDFANTVSSRHTATPIERLPSYAELVSFARQTGLVSDAEARALVARGDADPGAAREVLERAIELREALHRLFAAVAEDRAPAPDDVARLDAEIPRLRIGDDLSLSWRDDPDAFDAFLGAVVKAAVELVTAPERRARVHLCEAPDCIWLFYDSSKNHSRRWCDMKQCGNRMKARRHYERRA